MRFLRLQIRTYCILLYFFPLFALSQERENKKLPVIAPQALWSITQADGWVKASNGQWMKYKNRIQRPTLTSLDDATFNSGLNLLGMDNFKQFEARKIKIDDRYLIILLKKFLNGKYKYEYLKKGFYVEENTAFVVIDTNKATFYPDSTHQSYEVPVFYSGVVTSQDNILQRISNAIAKQDIDQPSVIASQGVSTLTIYYKPVKDGSLCHFMIRNGNMAPIESNYLLMPIDDYYYEASKRTLLPLIQLIEQKR
jgi:hypothetical protein